MKILFDLNNETVGWYEVLKDIIIPFLGVLSTLVIGIVIANLLRNKEEKSKIKGLLIDHYMDYLSVRTKNIIFETDYSSYEILNGIVANYNSYLNSPNWAIAHDLILDKAAVYKEKAEKSQNQVSDWALYTHRFSFLLGEKKYLKYTQELENDIRKNMLQENSRKNFNNALLEEIKNDNEILKALNSNNVYEIKLGIHSIEELVVKKYNAYQSKFFNPYNKKVSDLINEY